MVTGATARSSVLGTEWAQGRRRRWLGQVQCEVMDLRNALIGIVYPFKKQCNTQEEYDAALKGSHTAVRNPRPTPPTPASSPASYGKATFPRRNLAERRRNEAEGRLC